MVNSEEKLTPKVSQGKQNVLWFILVLLLLAALAAVSFGLVPSAVSPHESKAQGKVNALEEKLFNMQSQVAVLQSKLEESEKHQESALAQKADASLLTQMTERLESLEGQVAELSKYSSTGALVLSAALMVKEAADTGRPFVYEAEVLRLLAKDTALEPQTEIMSRYAQKGLPTVKALVTSFQEINTAQPQPLPVEETPAPEVKKSWQKSLTEKLGALITIEYADKEKPAVSDEPAKDEVAELVKSKRLEEAAAKMQNNPKYQTPAFQSWQEDVAARRDFTEALQKIKALALAQMKAESVKAFSEKE